MRKLKVLAVAGLAGLAGLMLARGADTVFTARTGLITFTNSTVMSTGLLANTVVSGGTWSAVPQRVDGKFLLTTWDAGGTLTGVSNTTVYVDLNPDLITVVSNGLSVSGLDIASGTNTTQALLMATNFNGYGYWRVGKATTTSLTNQYFRLQFIWAM